MTCPDKDDISIYGGALNDYEAAIEDATTDRGAAGVNQGWASVAMMTRTALRCWARFSGHATTPVLIAAPNGHDAMWGNAGGDAPVVLHTGTGVYTLTWPTTVTDQLLVGHTLNLSPVCWGQAEGAVSYNVQCTKTAANQITVRVYLDSAGTANDAPGVTILVVGL